MIFVMNNYRVNVVNQYPQAYKIIKVTGGYMVFLTMDKYETWKKQK